MSDFTRGDDPVYNGFREGWAQQEKDELQARIDELESENAALQVENAELREAQTVGTVMQIPCKRGDTCYEVDPGHGIVTHTVTGYYAFDREIQYADGKHIVNGIEIDTWATDDNGGAWPDHYSGDEWENRICTRKDAEAALPAAPEQRGQRFVGTEVHP